LIDDYFDELKKTSTFKNYPFDSINEVVKEAVQNGFMQEAVPGGQVSIMTLQPVFTYFLKNKLNQLEDSSTALDLDTAFINYYNGLAGFLVNLLNSKKAEEQQMGAFLTKFEYENLFTTLEKLLNRQESIIEPFRAINSFHKLSNNHQDRLKISEMVLKRFAAYPPETLKGKLGMEFVVIIDSIGYSYIKMSQFEDARTAYLKVVELYNNSEAKEKIPKGIGLIYQSLGTVLSNLKDYESSQSYFQKALELYIEFDDKHFQAQVYQNLGNVSLELNDHESSQSYFQKALEIFIEFKDKHGQAQVYLGFANVLLELKKFESSKLYNQKAMEIYIEFDDKFSQADVYLNLGNVSSDLKDYESSQAYYKKSLEIYIEINDKHRQGRLYQSLGNVSLYLKDYESSQSYYQKSLEIFIGFKDKYAIADILGNARILAEESGDEGVLKEMEKMLAAHFSKEEVREFLNSTPDS
jgi:tetratricopeptide (TPR) repeat protein